MIHLAHSTSKQQTFLTVVKKSYYSNSRQIKYEKREYINLLIWASYSYTLENM